MVMMMIETVIYAMVFVKKVDLQSVAKGFVKVVDLLQGCA